MTITVGLDVYGAKIGICCPREFSFGANFRYKFGRFVRDVPYNPGRMDATVYVIEDHLPCPSFSALRDVLFCVGDFETINAKYGDVHSIVRYVMYAYTLSVLERTRKMLCCHASAVYDEQRNILLLFVGTAGAGKTSLLLSAIKRGWRVIGNDLVAVEVNEEYASFYTGPAYCPVRAHTLMPHISFLEEQGIGFDRDQIARKDWLATDNLELTPLSVAREVVQDPTVHLVLPRLEASAATASLLKIDKYAKIREEIYEYATEKIRTESLMNYRFPVPSFDREETMYGRIQLVEHFIKMIRGVYFAFGNPEGAFEQIESVLK